LSEKISSEMYVMGVIQLNFGGGFSPKGSFECAFVSCGPRHRPGLP